MKKLSTKPLSRRSQYYSSIYSWILKLKERNIEGKLPLVIGISAPQGAGKTTLTKVLVKWCEENDLRAVSLSIDDFYLTHKQQVRLAKKYLKNPYLQQRGYPGTHDIALGNKILNKLKLINAGEGVEIPVYDKAKYKGQGDRLPKRFWKKIFGPLDFVFFDGWMLGFSAVSKNQLPNSSFEDINNFLKAYRGWHDFLDAFIQLAPKEIQYVLKWRVEAEDKMRSEGRGGMSHQEIKAYVQKFIPAYNTYLPRLLKDCPVDGPILRYTLGFDRLPINYEPKKY